MFVETETAKQMYRAIERAQQWSYPSLITGSPGTGKTETLAHYMDEFHALYFEVDDKCKSPVGMYRRLADLLEVKEPGRVSYYDRVQGIERGLAHIGRARLLSRYQVRPMIFVDEQQKFEATALRELLRVCEQANCGLVLAGNAERLSKTLPADHGALDQIHSRIGYRVRLEQPKPADCNAFGTMHNVEGVEAYNALASYGSRTNLRALVKLLEEARHFAGEGAIQLQHLENAASTIHGTRDALRNPPRPN